MSALTDVINQNTRADDTFYPAGVPTDYSWYGGAEGTLVGPISPPSGYTGLQQWGLVEQEAGSNPSANVGATITVEDMNVWVLLTSGAWVEVQSQANQPIYGGNYSSDFATNNSTPLTQTVNSDGSVTFNGPPSGENDHVYHGQVGSINPADVIGIFEEMSIKDSPGAELVAQLGADWYSSPSSGASIRGAINSNWMQLTDQYQTEYATTVSAATLASDPPPPLQGSGTTPDPTSTSSPTPTPTVALPPTSELNVIQAIALVIGHLPSVAQATAWTEVEQTQGLSAVVDSFVASDAFGENYNNGVDVNPHSQVTAQEVQQLMLNATGSVNQPSVNAWVNSHLPVDQVVEPFALNSHFAAEVAQQIETVGTVYPTPNG